jgi:membrane-associated protease RseP (regulator of RpoE activity)
MTALAYTAGVLLFVVGVALSIGLHELGHLVPGKLYDVKVTQYFIGFGRTVWSRRRGETEYGVKAIPLGGYVKLVGMLPPDPGQDPTRVRSRNTGMFAQLVSDARAAEYEHVDVADHDRLFYAKPWWKRVVIMGSGVMTNLVLAFGLFAVVYMGYGVPEPTTTVSSVSKCVIAVTKANEDQPVRDCRDTDPVAPALAAGIRPGDRIVSINGNPVGSWGDIQHEIRTNGDHRADIVVERDGHRQVLHATTVVSPRRDPDDPERITKVGFLGITPTEANDRKGVAYVATTMADDTWRTVRTIAAMPQKLYHVARAALHLEPRDPTGPMSVVGAGRVAGEVAAQHEFPLGDRLMSLVLLLAGLNLFLAMLNLVPLPPFDGGGIATTLYEAGRRGLARVFHRPDPGAVDAAKLLPVTYAMAALLLVMSVILIYADIVAPVSLT